MPRLVLACLMFCFVTPHSFSLHAQIASEIKGQVVDPSGAAVPNASVHLTEMRTTVHYVTTTGSDGYFDFSSLVSGRYQLNAIANGFNPFVRTGLTLGVGQTLNVDMPMPIGGTREIVEV